MRPGMPLDPRMIQDDEVLLEGYKKIQECIENFKDVMKKTNACREYCDQKHFSVSGISYAKKVEGCCDSLEQLIRKLNEFSEKLISVVDKETLQEFKTQMEKEQKNREKKNK